MGGGPRRADIFLGTFRHAHPERTVGKRGIYDLYVSDSSSSDLGPRVVVRYGNVTGAASSMNVKDVDASAHKNRYKNPWRVSPHFAALVEAVRRAREKEII